MLVEKRWWQEKGGQISAFRSRCAKVEIEKGKNTFISNVVANFNLSLYITYMDPYLRLSCTIGQLRWRKLLESKWPQINLNCRW